MKIKSVLFLTTLVAILLPTASAQDLSQLPLEQRMSILEDKAFLDFPAGAVNITQVPGPESPLYHEHDHMVIRLVLGEDSLRFWATNEFSFAEDDFLKEWLSPKTPLEDHRKVLINQDGLVAVLLTPSGFNAEKPKVHLHRLFVRTPDNLRFRISVDINKAAFPRKDDYLQLAERVFRTLRVGKPDKGLLPRQETCAIADSKWALVFDLPAQYYILRHQDRSLQTFGVRYYYVPGMGGLWYELTVSIAEESDLYFQGHKVPEKDIRQIEGTFLGEKTKWLAYHESGRNKVYVREQIFPFDVLGPGIKLHVRMTTNDPKRLDELTYIAERIRLVEM